MKEYLSSKGILYQDHDVNADPSAAQDAVRLTGQNAVPVIVIDGKTVVGFSQPLIEQLIYHAQASTPPKFGAAVADVGKAGREKVPIAFGAYVGRITTGSIAEKVGLLVSDVIIQLNSQPISSAADLERFLLGIKQGDKLSIVFIRGTEVKTAEVTA